MRVPINAIRLSLPKRLPTGSEIIGVESPFTSDVARFHLGLMDPLAGESRESFKRYPVLLPTMGASIPGALISSRAIQFSTRPTNQPTQPHVIRIHSFDHSSSIGFSIFSSTDAISITAHSTNRLAHLSRTILGPPTKPLGSQKDRTIAI